MVAKKAKTALSQDLWFLVRELQLRAACAVTGNLDVTVGAEGLSFICNVDS